MRHDEEFEPDWFSKPGDSLRSLMLRRQVTAAEVARSVPGGMTWLRGLIDGTNAVRRPEAIALAKLFGGTAAFWLNRQANYEVALERAVDRALATESEEWLRLPVPGDKPRGRHSNDTRRSEVRRRLAFFNVGTMRAWNLRYGRVAADTMFRKSGALASDRASILMWLRMGELSADLVDTRPWCPQNLRDRLSEIRKLSIIKDPSRFFPKLKVLCSEAGVAIVAKRAPEGCPASGASRMVAANKAMILLSFRGLSDDKFWFTVLHEIGHLLLHGASPFVDAELDGYDDVEREANDFASQFIVPQVHADEFTRLRPIQNDVVRYSVRVGVSPGLVVGQMQHRKMIRQDQLNYLKRRWKWDQLAQVLD